MHDVLVAVVVLFVIGVTFSAIVAVLLALKAARALRTGYRSVHTQVSEQTAATFTTLQAHVLPAGPRQEVAELRHHLRRSRDATGRLLVADSGPLGQLSDWANQLAQVTDSLDRQLAGLQREPDTAHMRAALTALRPQAREAITTGAELRSAIRQAGSTLAATDLGPLTSRIRDEVQAVRAGIAYLQSQTAVSPLPAASSSPSS